MMKRGGMILAVAAFVALTGCSASPSEPLTAETNAPATASASPKGAPAANPSPSPSADPESEFVDFIHASLARDGMDDLSDKEILKYGMQVCKELKAGVTHPEVVPASVKESVWKSKKIYTFAPGMLCPELRG